MTRTDGGASTNCSRANGQEQEVFVLEFSSIFCHHHIDSGLRHCIRCCKIESGLHGELWIADRRGNGDNLGEGRLRGLAQEGQEDVDGFHDREDIDFELRYD